MSFLEELKFSTSEKPGRFGRFSSSSENILDFCMFRNSLLRGAEASGVGIQKLSIEHPCPTRLHRKLDILSDRENIERLERSALIEVNSHAETAESAEEFLCGLRGLRVSRSRLLAHVGLCSQFSLVS